MDNTTLNSGSGGDTIATDDISGVKYPRSKIVIGADGVNDGDVSSANPMPVTVSGVATAANQTTGNASLASAVTALQIVDDWDESDRAKVNLIVGQAGIAAGTGVDGATVPRVSLATDVPLPTGTNAIGKLSANDGVDIGDVDVTSLPGELSGPGSPTIDSYSSAAISAAANTANQQLVAAPGASKQIWVYGLVGTADTGDGSISLQDEDDTAISGVMPVKQYGGFALAPSGNFAMPLFKVPTNKALEIDTVTCGFKGAVQYAIVSV